MEEKVSESLPLRPYPGIDPPATTNEIWWWWLVAAFILGLLLCWWLRRSAGVPRKTPEDALQSALAAAGDITVDSTRRYARLHRCLRDFLGWAVHPRWKALTGTAWELAMTELWPAELGAEQLTLFVERWRQGEVIQFGLGTSDEQEVHGYAALIRSFVIQLAQKIREKRPVSTSSA